MKTYRHRWLGSALLIGLLMAATSQGFQWGNSFISYTGGPPSPPTGFLADIDIAGTPQQGWTFARYSNAGSPLDLHRRSEGLFTGGGLDVPEDQNLSNATYALAEQYWSDSTYFCGKSWVETTSGSYKKAYAEVHD